MNSVDIVELSLVLKKFLATNQPLNNQEKHKMMHVIYTLENNLGQIKADYYLQHLDSSIISDSVSESFFREIRKQKQSGLFKEDKTYEFRDYLRGLDYQYWFLIFLLLKNNEILDQKIILHQIIDKFIDRIKNDSFKYEDIMIMSSGATRCKTNLRFAVNSLRKAGLINYYDENHKQSWTLTYLGFFTAASFIKDPDEKRKDVFSKKISRITESSWIFDLDPFIKNRIYQLAEPGYFLELIEYLEIGSLGLSMLEKGYEIFGNYREFFEQHVENLAYRKADKEFQKICEKFIQEQSKRYDLPGFMRELAMKFKAEEFFRDLMNEIR